MPARISWYLKDYIFLVQGKGAITDEEYLAFSGSPLMAEAMDRSPAQLVHYFFEVVDPNTTLPSLRVIGKTQQYSHEKDGWAIIVNFKLNPFWRMTAALLAQASRSRSRFVDNYEQGLRLLRRIDPALPQHAEPQILWLFDINWESSAPDPVMTHSESRLVSSGSSQPL